MQKVTGVAKRRYIPVAKRDWLTVRIPAHARIAQQLDAIRRDHPRLSTTSAQVAAAVNALYKRIGQSALAEAEYQMAIEGYGRATAETDKRRIVYVKQPTLDQLAALADYFAQVHPQTPYLRGGDNRRVLIVLALLLYKGT